MNLLNALLIAASLQTPPSIEADFETALGIAGLTSRTARFDDNLLRFFGGAEFTSPIYTACSENPWRIPFFAETIRRDLSTMIGRPSDSMSVGTRLLGFGTRRTLIGNPNATIEEASKQEGALAKVLNDMKAAGYIKGAVPAVASVPKQVQSSAALVLSSVMRVVSFRRIAFANSGDMPLLYGELLKPNLDEVQGEDFATLLKAYRSVDLKNLAAGGHDLAHAVQTATSGLAGVPATETYSFEVDTSWGTVRLSGAGEATVGSKPILLSIDTGGNDTYINCPSNTSASNWASVVIDTQGNDKYMSDKGLENTTIGRFAGRKNPGAKPGPGGAMLGYAYLFDTNGQDLYRTHRPGLGSARLGMAALVDTDDNDVYDAYIDSQGFGMFGAGVLEDTDGNDKYEGFSQVQGTGQTMGFGYLADRTGDDRYICNDQVIDFPSPQSAEHNVSMSQGAGNGRRADYLEGHSLAGGLGILHDSEGKDGYSVGVFGQGVGYWQGVGFLWDIGKADEVYVGQWYVQGASAHFAIGYIEDEAGNDTYTSPMNMAQGAGHDFSVGMLMDRAGDDTHRAPNLSLGAGNANGIGIYADLAGNDTYESTGITLGSSAEATKASLRARALSLGVFLDLGGTDTYPAQSTWAKNGDRVANWKDKGPTGPESQVGVFFDRS